MTEWDVTITYDMPCPDGDMLADLIGGPIVTAGRSPWSDRLQIGVSLHAGPWALDDVVSAVTTMTLSAFLQAGTGDPVTGGDPMPLAIECLTAAETERRTPEPSSIRSRYVTAAEAAEMLGISARAVRQQAGGLGGEQVGEAGWIFPRARVEADAARRRELAAAGLVDGRDALDSLAAFSADVGDAVRAAKERSARRRGSPVRNPEDRPE